MNEADPVPFNSPAAEELPIAVCPACSARLKARHCKMVGPRYGYFMSCSEFE